MQINFNIDISADDQAALIKVLDCPAADLQQVLSRHGLAALHEHIECYLGRRASARGNDILEHRLVLLTRFAFGNRIPNDVKVSRLFQTTLTASRTLIRNMLARYRGELNDASIASAKVLLEEVTWPGGKSDDYRAKNPPSNMVEFLNQRLLIEDPAMKQITRLADSGGIYAINKYSYDELCRVFQAIPVARP